jgi:hypothetical protein
MTVVTHAEPVSEGWLRSRETRDVFYWANVFAVNVPPAGRVLGRGHAVGEVTAKTLSAGFHLVTHRACPCPWGP